MISTASSTSPTGTPRPRLADVVRDVLRRAVLPGLIVFALLYGVGRLIMGPLWELPGEEVIAQWFADRRTPLWDTVTHYWSTSTDTALAIGFAIFWSLVVLVVTRRWWLGMVPGLAVILEASIFVAVTNLTDRPRPEVPMMDQAPPTSSYPSGHTAAAMALYLSLALLAQRIRTTWLRRLVIAICIIWPIGVGVSRLYRGMHHLSDVVIGALLGIWCGWTAYHCGDRADDRADERQVEAR